MAFIYVDKPAQLCYLDSVAGMVLLPFWIVDSNNLMHAERTIRARFWGNIPFTDFYIRVWNNYNYGQPDGETYWDAKVFSGTGFPTTTPAPSVLKNNFLT